MIWCVEDDSSIRDIEVYALTSTGFEAKGFEDGDSFWNALQSEKPELIVLDVMLPGKDGVTLLKLMKANEAFADIPVIMATAKGSEYDKIQSLDLGADDYLVKPFGMLEMVSRVKAVLRRTESAGQEEYRIGSLYVCPAKHLVLAGDQEVKLALKEFELLCLLLRNNGMVLTRDALLNQIWGYSFDGESRTVDVHIRNLRKKLGDAGACIETVKGIGYKIGGLGHG